MGLTEINVGLTLMPIASWTKAIASWTVAAPHELMPVSFLPSLIAQTESVATGEVNLLQAVILGLVQGITEFLPISSTAHLLVFTRVFGWDVLGEKYFVDAIQFGSVIAVLIYFWADIQQTLTGSWTAFRKKNWEQDE